MGKVVFSVNTIRNIDKWLLPVFVLHCLLIAGCSQTEQLDERNYIMELHKKLSDLDIQVYVKKQS